MHKDIFINFLKFEKRYSNHTIVAYNSDLNQFTSYVLLEYEIENILEVNHHIIRSWIAFLLDSGVTSRSVNRKITAIKSFYKFLIQEELLEENPTRKILSPKSSNKLPVFLEESKMEELFDKINFQDILHGERDKLILDVFYMTGIRLTELINLNIADVNLENSSIKVVGKRNKERIIPISSNLLIDLKKFVKKTSNSKLLFTCDKEKKLTPKKVYNIVHKYLSEISSVNKKSPHVLRHTFATHMLNNGADINVIKEILGHSNLRATQVYTHNTIDRLKSIYKQAHPRA